MTLHLDIWRVGRIAYGEALDLQQALVEARQSDRIGDTLLLLEHPPTVTLGRGARNENLLLSREAFAEAGIEVHDVGRGGDVTYHGPGQLVGYPIIDLKPDRMDVRKYVASLEETMIRTCAEYGVVASRLEKFNGTWLDADGLRPRKIGAVGVRISRWVTMHGFALNVDPTMSHFQLIVPCGIQGKGVTSLALETTGLETTGLETTGLGTINPPDLARVTEDAGRHFAAIHQMDATWHDGRPSLPE